MKTFDVSCPPRGLVLGYAGENVARGQAFDFTAWAEEYGAGSLQVALQRPGDAAPYPVALTVEGTVATWLPTETDLQEAGTGQLQLIYTVGTVRVKTLIVSVLIGPSLGSSGEVPAPGQAWIDQLTDLAAVTEQNAASAAESAENAETSAEDAQQSATDAVAAKNAAVAAAEAAAASASHYPQIVNGVWYVWSPTAGAYISTGIDAQGEDGVSPTVEITAIQGGHRVVITDAAGPHTFDVMDGVTPDLSAYRTAADQDVIDDAQDDQIDDLKSALDTKAGILRDTASGSVASFVPDSTVPNLLGVTVDIEPVQAGSGDPSPDNVRPISGWDSVEVEAAGVNLFGGTVINGRVPFDLKPGVTYTASAQFVDPSVSTYFYIQRAPKGTGTYSTFGYILANYMRTPVTFTADAGYDYAFWSNASYANVKDAQIETGSTAHDYHPYVGTTYTIQLGETVYGGTLDVTNGTLTVDRAKTTVGALSWSLYNTAFYASIQMGTAERPISTQYKSEPSASSMGDASGWAGYSIRAHTSGIYIYIKDTRYSTAPDFETAEADTEIVYELATPIVIDLDPVQIAAIANQTNNVRADAGDVTVEFAADLKTYIDSKIAAAVAALS